MNVKDVWTCVLRRADIRTPILMLTALVGAENAIKGLDEGADDYLAKPFHAGELLARVRSLVRRQSEVRTSVLEKYGLVLDLRTHQGFPRRPYSVVDSKRVRFA